MRAYVFDVATRRASLQQLAEPVPGEGEVAIAVEACGLGRTDLHILDGDLVPPGGRIVLGHQVVGWVSAVGAHVDHAWIRRRVGVPWLATTCGHCRACTDGRDNLCSEVRCTGLHVDGGLAEVMVAASSSCLPVPDGLDAIAAAPLVGAGAIGWRALGLAGAGDRIGLYGFGAAAHLLAQVLRWQRRELYAFTRPGDQRRQEYARSLGAVWAGGSDQRPPALLDAAIIFADDGALVPRALAAVAPGGTVVCAELHLRDLPSFPCQLLGREKVVRSVAGPTRRDVAELLAAAAHIPLAADVRVYPLASVDDAIADLRAGRVHGAAVVRPG